MLITVLVGTLLSPPISADKLEIKYSDIVYQAINNCPGLSSTKVDQKLIWDLVKIENKYNPPKSLRGMLLAAACQESKYNPNAECDRKFSKRRKPKAIGILQQ